MMPSQHGGSRRHAPRPDVRVIEPHTVFGKLVDVGRLDEVVRLWVTTNRPMRMIIRVNKQNVRSLFA